MPLLDRQAFADPTLPVPSWSNIKGAVRGLMGMVTPPDPYEEAGRMVQQGRAGDYLGALETGFGAMPTTGAIKAYHGSPHSFDRFDLSKIGTGEGAQAYGHGLYFADNEKVAKAYRDALSEEYDLLVNGKKLSQFPSHEKDVYNYIYRQNKSPAEAVTHFQAQSNKDAELLRELGIDVPGGGGDPRLNYARTITEPPKFESVPGGHMYEVNINANPEHFLDWDKPLSAQPKAIQDIVSAREFSPSYVPTHEKPMQELLDEAGIGRIVKSQNVLAKSGNVDLNAVRQHISSNPAMLDRFDKIMADHAAATEPKGSDIYYALAGTYKSDDGGLTRAAGSSGASYDLAQAGVPGIKYLDQGSRNPTAMLPQLQQHLSQTEGTLANFDRMPAPPGMDRNAWRSQLEGKAASLRDEIANTPEPSRNYVVFDDKLVDIARKYGLLPLGMGGFDFGQQEQK